MIEEHDASAGLVTQYVHGAREDEMIAKIDSFGTVYYHTDAEGSVVALTNSSGNVIERYKYDAFGKPSFFDSTSQPINGSTVGNRFLFTGREWLPDLDLYDYRNRAYSPEFGRFLQSDPKSFDADPTNLYRYCNNDPLDLTDPMGLQEGPAGQHEEKVATQEKADIEVTGTHLKTNAANLLNTKTLVGQNTTSARSVESAYGVVHFDTDVTVRVERNATSLRDRKGNDVPNTMGGFTEAISSPGPPELSDSPNSTSLHLTLRTQFLKFRDKRVEKNADCIECRNRNETGDFFFGQGKRMIQDHAAEHGLRGIYQYAQAVLDAYANGPGKRHDTFSRNNPYKNQPPCEDRYSSH